MRKWYLSSYEFYKLNVKFEEKQLKVYLCGVFNFEIIILL